MQEKRESFRRMKDSEGFTIDKIIFSDFTKQFREVMAVDHMNLTVKQGSITGFVGKNGAGKSTTLRALMNIIFPSSGSICVNGLDSVKDAKRIKHDLSYMPSDAAFYEGITVLDLFRFCAKLGEGSVEDAMQLAEYFELDLHKKISELSLGNRKKVSIVQAFMKESTVYILDEPTSGLDPLMQEKFFQKLLEKQRLGATIFLSSHNLGEIEKYCERVVIIKNGTIVDNIDMKEAQKHRKLMVSYVTAQEETYQFSYDGEINDLIKELSLLDLKQLEIRPASMEEAFISYYTEEESEGNTEDA